MRVVSIRTFAVCFPLLSTGIAFSQTSGDVNFAATAAAAGVAYVYVGTSKGVYLYDAASNGSLSLVSGSPFSIAGNAVGSNGKYFVSLGTNYLHSYHVTSNGAIQAPASQINTHSYSGNECGTAYQGVFDHTGQEVYVELPFNNPVGTPCSALQSYKISSTGALSFLGATEFNQTITSTPTPIALTGNGSFAYSFAGVGFCTTSTYAFQRESSGAMMLDSTPKVTNPSAPAGWDLAPQVAAADPTNHLAISELGIPGYCYFAPAQLASFTVDSSGNMVSTNATANMPEPLVYPTVLNMSPSGQLLAVGGNTPDPNGNSTQTPGLQVFHFNGANPITPYSGVLTTAPIDEIHWDNNNHVYALSNSSRSLYAYTVTATSITAVPGSPFAIASTPNALVVVPTPACATPSSNGVHICAPAGGSTLGSPVSVEAFSTITGTIARMELWVDGMKKYTAASSTQLNSAVSLGAGTHRFVVLAINTAGTTWQSVVSATVK